VLDKPDDVLPLTSLSAVSAVDGRYADTTAPLRRYFSEVNVVLCAPVLQMSCVSNLTQYVTVSFTYLRARFQFALIHHRVFIEIKWLQLLSRLDTIPAVRGVWIDSMRASIEVTDWVQSSFQVSALSTDALTKLNLIYENFSLQDATVRELYAVR